MESGNPAGGHPFDPCRQWLGISALELDDPRKLLGLESVDDPIRILQAAEARIARLQGVDAGPYEVARRALLARVEEARDRLLSATTTTGLPASPAPAGSLTMPPSPTADLNVTPFPGPLYPPAAHPHAPVHPHASGPGYTAGSPGYPGYAPAIPGSSAYPPHPEPGVVPAFPAPLQHPAPGAPYDGLRGTGPIYRPSSSNGPLLLLVGALFTVVAALGLFAMQSPPSKAVASKPRVDKPVVKKPSSSKPVEDERRVASRERVREKPAGMEEARPRAPSSRDEPDSRNEPDSSGEPASPPPTPGDDTPEPVPPQPENPQPPTPSRPPAPPEPTPPSEPPMKKPEPPPADEPDVLAKIDDAVKRCLEAVSRREYDTAERVMKAVEGIAPEKREANRIAGWLQLAMYAKGFYDYRDQAIAAMKPGDEYDVKSKKIAVVEVTDESLTVKVTGQQKTWPRDDIPGAVVQAVVESWFDANPANQLYLGAYHFTKPEPDLEQAEACWSKAMIGGADASLLIPLLTDPIVVEVVEAVEP